MLRKWFTRLLGVSFMLCGVYQAVISIKLFTENHDGGSLAINLVGALLFLLVGAGASGLLKLLLKKAGVSMTALAVNFKAIAAGTLVAVVLLSGIVMLFFGVRNTLRFTEKTRDYVTTQGEYAGKEIYSTDEDGTTYRLAYTYTVDGIQYTVLSNSGTQIIPKLGTEKEIRYDPQNPEVAVVAGDGVHTVLLFMGSALRSAMNALLNGSGNYRINFVTAILDGFVMRIGLSVLFGLALDMRHYGFWLGDALAGFTPFFIGIVFYFTGFWKKPMTKD